MADWKYFNPAKTEDENKKLVRKLLMLHHPDKNNDSKASNKKTLEILAEYERYRNLIGNKHKGFFQQVDFETAKKNYRHWEVEKLINEILRTPGQSLVTKVALTIIKNSFK